MRPTHHKGSPKSPRLWHVIRLSPILFVLLTVIVVFFLLIGTQIRLEVILIAALGTLYMILIEIPFRASHKAIAETAPHWVAIGNTLIITLAVTLFGAVTPLIAAYYPVSIAAMAARHGLRFAVWTAFLSTLGYLTALTLAGIIQLHVTESVALIGIFFLIALLTGSIAEAARRRAHELAAERVVAMAVSQPLDLQRVLDLALDQALVTLHVSAGAIYLADEAQTELTLAVWRHPSPEYAMRWDRHRLGEGITGQAAARREAIIVHNLDQDPRVSQERRESPRLLSQVSVPLIAQNRLVGVLNVNGYEPRDFSEADAALLRAIATSVAVAIDHARLFETLEQRVAERTAELAALNQIAASVNQSLALDEIMDTALGELTHTLSVRGGWIHLLDPERKELILRAEREESGTIRAYYQTIRADQEYFRQIVQNRQPFTMNLEEVHVKTSSPSSAAGYRSICGVPLTVEDRVVGALGMASDQRDRFGETELRWLGGAANTIAVALKNARLFESVERQLKQLAALREIDHDLSSMLDLKPMLETMLECLEEVVPFDSAAVLLRDKNSLRAVAARGREQSLLQQFELDISDNVIFREMDAKRTTILIRDLSSHPGWVVVPGVQFAQAWLGAPLVARGEIIGQLGLFSAAAGAFTREHCDLLLAFANHAAIAIANAQLHAELHEQARHDSLTQVLTHGAFITDLHKAYAETQSRGESLAMIMLDLDAFKHYNDTYGHVVGDMVLTATVQAIRAHVKRADLIGRWGGEEFAIALPGANLADALRVAQRIRATLAGTAIKDRQGQPILAPTASQGTAAAPETAHAVDELIEQADRALYRAKANGRDQIARVDRGVRF